MNPHLCLNDELGEVVAPRYHADGYTPLEQSTSHGSSIELMHNVLGVDWPAVRFSPAEDNAFYFLNDMFRSSLYRVTFFGRLYLATVENRTSGI